MDKIQLQLDSERLFHRNQIMVRIREEFTSDPDIMAKIDGSGLDPDFCLDLLCQMVIHKQCSIATMVGILRHHAGGEKNGCQLVADGIAKAVEELVDYNPRTKNLVVLWNIDDATAEEIATYKYPQPLVVPPLEIRTNNETGYHHFVKGTVFCGNAKSKDEACLDHINRLNAVPLKLNTATVTVMKNHQSSLDARKPDESAKDFAQRQRQHENYTRYSNDVLWRLGILNDGEFWLTHQLDFRGRTYCRGYHVSYQGNDWAKSAVALADEEITQ